MGIESVNHSLELEENINLHKKGWVVQRILWILLFLFIIAAALGFFGNGPLSKEKLTIKGTALEFEKFTRYKAETVLKIEASSSSITTVSLPQSYIHYFDIEKTIPEPSETRSENGNIVYSFNTGENSLIKIMLKPGEVGKVKGEILVNGESFNVSQFIYP